MKNHQIKSNKLYILSGPSCSGKSFFTDQLIEQGLPKESIVSSDKIRENILGSIRAIDEFGEFESIIGWDTSSNEIYSVILSILNIRLKQKLTTIIDMTSLTDSDRKKYIDIASEHGVDYEILIFNNPIETLKERLKNRKNRFDSSVIDNQVKLFQNTSKYNYSVVNQDDKFTLMPNLLEYKNTDIIGDTHGLLNETVKLLEQNKWVLTDNGFVHPENRKVLFLGDILDRGKQSIELLKAIKQTVDAGNGFIILGNHEAKLINSYEIFVKHNIIRGKSLSSSQTFMDFLRLPKEEQKELYTFLKNSPTYYVSWINQDNGNLVTVDDINNNKPMMKFAFIHANNRFFSPYNITYSHALYGEKMRGTDTDSLYNTAFDKNINDHICIRGHVCSMTKQDTIYSLEDNQAFAGNVVLLKFDDLIDNLKEKNWNIKHSLFEGNIMKQKSEYNFNDEMKERIELLKGLNELFDKGLITDGWRKNDDGVKQEHPDGFKIYKYGKKVFFDRLWKEYPLLEKARGLGIDIAGNIIVQPFDKIYNYGEYDTGVNLDINKKVQVIEKLNGFLGNISPHPIRNELLYSTTGSFVSPFIQYIKDFINPEYNEKLLNFFKENKMTLMFEVIHPEDKHIIEYSDSEHGLYLIGARTLNYNSPLLTEKELDTLGLELGFKRPSWTEKPLSEAIKDMNESKLEGFMIRDAETNETLMKMKTTYYLVTKFVGRMGSKMVSHMYSNSEHFKEHHMEEEFYPIVDRIITTATKEEFSDMSQADRVEFVRNIANDIREDLKKTKKSEFKPK